ncbi:MAG: hypothetical protein IPJ00_18295 [Saprospirales bacterium]|nr:hypothetical protein [Saprospirales bacterium]MBK7337984.1 hypothetical protein [Saprospirales bacterium]
MKRSARIIALLPFFLQPGLHGFSQDSQWTLLDAPGKLLRADVAQTDESGWTHYYESKQNKLILSIQKNGQQIGELDELLSISSGLLNNYGKGANDLSGADYIQNAIWLTFNRYWRIQGAGPLAQAVKVRFYFNKQDIDDLKAGLQRTDYQLQNLESVQFYALEGGSLHPFAIRTRSGASVLRRLETGSTASLGNFGPFMYAEFQLKDLSSSGSGGFYIPLEGQRFSISGKITSPTGDPIEDVYVKSRVEGAAIRTTGEGEYTVANLQGGRDYEIIPFSQDRPTRMVTVLDLIGLAQHLVRKEKWDTAWKQIAADADQSGTVEEQDLSFLQELILGDQTTFPEGSSWQFVPAAYIPPEMNDRRTARLPDGSILVETLAQHVQGVDFKAVKTGNVWREQDFPNEPPSILDPSFSLPDQNSCGGGELLHYDLVVNDFVGIRGFQFTLQWDPSVMVFDGVKNFNLPFFDLADFGTAHVREGKLTLAWYTPERPNTIKLPDGEAVCTLLFRAVGKHQSSTAIRFVDDPTPVQVLRDNLSAANVFFTMGSLRIEGESPMFVAELNTRPQSCYGKPDGAISIKIGGGFPPYRYEWSNGSTAPSLYGLQPGKYKVTVYDGAACPLTTDSIQVPGPPELVLHSHNIHQIRCPGFNDGAISFKVSGGAPPYRYEWSNGAITPWIGQLSEGIYGVTVSDLHGCQKEETFTIEARQDIFLNYSIKPATGPFTNDGEVILRDLIGSPGPQTYEWNSGLKSTQLTRATVGSYEVNIRDAEGCAYKFSFEIPSSSLPEKLSALLEKDLFQEEEFAPVKIESPEDQTLHFKVYDDRSRLISQQVIEVAGGTTVQYFQTPTSPGSYLIQILPRGGNICSLRFRVK